jgi:hypothetical protein
MSRLNFVYVLTLLCLFATSALSLEAGLYKVVFNSFPESVYRPDELAFLDRRPGDLLWITNLGSPYLMQAEIYYADPKSDRLSHIAGLPFRPGPSTKIVQQKSQRLGVRQNTVIVNTVDNGAFRKIGWDLTVHTALFDNFRTALIKFLAANKNKLSFQGGFPKSEEQFLEQRGGTVTQDDFARLAYWFELK